MKMRSEILERDTKTSWECHVENIMMFDAFEAPGYVLRTVPHDKGCTSNTRTCQPYILQFSGNRAYRRISSERASGPKTYYSSRIRRWGSYDVGPELLTAVECSRTHLKRRVSLIGGLRASFRLLVSFST